MTFLTYLTFRFYEWAIGMVFGVAVAVVFVVFSLLTNDGKKVSKR